jgi:hypothetical protein
MPDAEWRGTIPPYDVEPDDEPAPANDGILSEKERQRAEFVGTTLAIMQGDAAEIHQLRTGGAIIVVGSWTWQKWHERAAALIAEYNRPDHPF